MGSKISLKDLKMISKIITSNMIKIAGLQFYFLRSKLSRTYKKLSIQARLAYYTQRPVSTAFKQNFCS